MIAALILAAAVAIPPRPSEYVTDDTHVLSAAARTQIRDELQAYEHATKHHVIVWIGQTTGDIPLEDWTIRAAEQWKVGRKGIDDGAILFLFMRDHKVRIEVGYGLESALTDAQAGLIIRHTIVPKLRSGDTDGAVAAGVNKILLTVTPSFATQIHGTVGVSSSGEDRSNLAAAITITVIIVVVLLAMTGSNRRRRGAWYWGGYSGGGFSGGGGGGFSGSFGGGFGGGGASGGW